MVASDTCEKVSKFIKFTGGITPDAWGQAKGEKLMSGLKGFL